MDEFPELRAKLGKMSPGIIPTDARGEILAHIEACWDKFEGANEAKMEVWKIRRGDEPQI